MKGKILIVDDDPLLIKLLEIKLQKENFHPCSVSDGMEALEKTKHFKPDVIISDIIMPNLDGYELHHRLRNDPTTAHIPFVFLSAKTSPSEQLEGFRMGADDYLCKPFDFRDLFDRIDRVMQKAAMARSYNTQADFSGDLTQMKLVDIIQIIELNHKTGELVFKNPKGKQTGKAFFKNGNLINAHMGLLKDEEAFYGLMGELDGFFEFFGTTIDVPETITTPNMSVLLNGTRLIDEAMGATKSLPDTHCHFYIRSRDLDSSLENKIGAHNIQELFHLIEEGYSYQHLIDSGRMSKPRILSALSHLLKKNIIEVVKSPTDSKSIIDKNLIHKIHEININGLSGVLHINNGPSGASIHFQDGEIIHAACGFISGKKALFRILSQTAQEFDFSSKNLSETGTIQCPLDKLLIDATREIRGLKMLDDTLWDKTVLINGDRLDQVNNADNQEELVHVIELAKKHDKIRDIMNASNETDLNTIRSILELNNLNVIGILKQ